MALRCFERAAARLSFKLAAQELSMTPSAVSHQVRGLERRFGVRFFSRAGRRVALTPAGEQYLVAVKSALDVLDNGARTLSMAKGAPQVLRISALPFFISNVMLPRLGEFLRDVPGLTLRLEATTEYADFDSTKVDVAIRMGRERAAGLHFDKLIDVRAVPVCAPTLTRGSKAIRSAADLTQHTLLQSSLQPGVWPAWLAQAGVPGLVPAAEMWFDNVSLALEAAEHGLGVALAMDPIIQARPGFGHVLVAPLAASSKIVRSYYAACRPEQKDERAISALRRWLLQITRDLRGLPGVRERATVNATLRARRGSSIR
jgi:LysR family transcriptional regulator, glycine cleavage system transcriptional activator